MKIQEYETIYRLEFQHWWYRVLDNLILDRLKVLAPSDGSMLLDVGCGTGRLLKKLSGPYRVVGVDLSAEALRMSKSRHIDTIIMGEAVKLPFASGCFDIAISIDVLYHNSIVNDRLALDELYRILKPGGILILHVAALEMLRGTHDVQVETRERYTKRRLVERLENSHFVISTATYRLFIFFPVFLLHRLLKRIKARAESDLYAIPAWINSMFFWLGRLENRWLKQRSVPIGSSLFLVAHRM